MEADINDVELLATVDRQAEAAAKLLATVASDYAPATLANSLGAEDMVLTDIIVRNKLPIEIFSLDTGRLPTETYDLIQRLRRHYGLTLKIYFPRNDLVESFVREHPRNPLPDTLTWETYDARLYGRAHWLVIDKVWSAKGEAASMPDLNRYPGPPVQDFGLAESGAQLRKALAITTLPFGGLKHSLH